MPGPSNNRGNRRNSPGRLSHCPRSHNFEVAESEPASCLPVQGFPTGTQKPPCLPVKGDTELPATEGRGRTLHCFGLGGQEVHASDMSHSAPKSAHQNISVDNNPSSIFLNWDYICYRFSLAAWFDFGPLCQLPPLLSRCCLRHLLPSPPTVTTTKSCQGLTEKRLMYLESSSGPVLTNFSSLLKFPFIPLFLEFIWGHLIV